MTLDSQDGNMYVQIICLQWCLFSQLDVSVAGSSSNSKPYSALQDSFPDNQDHGAGLPPLPDFALLAGDILFIHLYRMMWYQWIVIVPHRTCEGWKCFWSSGGASVSAGVAAIGAGHGMISGKRSKKYALNTWQNVFYSIISNRICEGWPSSCTNGNASASAAGYVIHGTKKLTSSRQIVMLHKNRWGNAPKQAAAEEDLLDEVAVWHYTIYCDVFVFFPRYWSKRKSPRQSWGLNRLFRCFLNLLVGWFNIYFNTILRVLKVFQATSTCLRQNQWWFNKVCVCSLTLCLFQMMVVSQNTGLQ